MLEDNKRDIDGQDLRQRLEEGTLFDGDAELNSRHLQMLERVDVLAEVRRESHKTLTREKVPQTIWDFIHEMEDDFEEDTATKVKNAALGMARHIWNSRKDVLATAEQWCSTMEQSFLDMQETFNAQLDRCVDTGKARMLGDSAEMSSESRAMVDECLWEICYPEYSEDEIRSMAGSAVGDSLDNAAIQLQDRITELQRQGTERRIDLSSDVESMRELTSGLNTSLPTTIGIGLKEFVGDDVAEWAMSERDETPAITDLDFSGSAIGQFLDAIPSEDGYNAFVEVLEGKLGEIRDAAHDVVDSFRGEMCSTIRRTLENVVVSLDGVVSGVRKTVVDASAANIMAHGEIAKNLLGQMWDVGQEVAAEEINEEEDVLPDNFEPKARGFLGDMANKLKSVASKAKNAAIAASKKVADVAKNVATKVKDKVKEKLGKTKDAAKKTADVTKKETKDAANETADKEDDTEQDGDDGDEEMSYAEKAFGEKFKTTPPPDEDDDEGEEPEPTPTPQPNPGYKPPSYPVGTPPVPPPGYVPPEANEQPPSDIDPEDTTQAEPSSVETPMGNDSASGQDRGLIPTSYRPKQFGWKSLAKADIPTGATALMHEGDQQYLNPYGHTTGDWTMYSFRPCDADAMWPQIAITPASFEAIKSMKTMLNNIPYVVVREYFFKNTASTMMNFLRKIMGAVKEAKESPPDPNDTKSDNSQDKDSKGAASAKEEGNTLMDKIKEKFQTLTLKETAIDVPYILYCCLRKKLYGNTYIFPYIVESGTIINKADNTGEWNPGESGGITAMLKKATQSIAEVVGGLAAGLSGSQAKVASLFPAPTWGGPGQDKNEFKFDLILINDHIIKSRNNYMCVNTIINNNRYIQKAILAFPGALYEVWLPTGQRHLMCSASLQLSPLGLNRVVPKGFFDDAGVSGANFQIGVNQGDAAKLQNPENIGHNDSVEVIPDAYKLSVNFQSCLANNLNTSVFQYYVKMTGYDQYSNAPMESTDSWDNQLLDKIKGNQLSDKEMEEEMSGGSGGGQQSPAPTPSGVIKMRSSVQARPMSSRDEYEQEMQEIVEKFYESTYNKRLGRWNPATGQQSIMSESAVSTVKKSQQMMDEVDAFFEKLYNAKDRNLWYRDDPDEELYVTMQPDYRKAVREKYVKTIRKMGKVQEKIDVQNGKLDSIQTKLADTTDLDKRAKLLVEQVHEMAILEGLRKKKAGYADEALKMDVDLVQTAFETHDMVVSLKRNVVSPRLLEQAWNENIMNAYEKDKLQYLTSVEKQRYLQEKVRELRKLDVHGILNHSDWYFRVVVIDVVVREMAKLVHWFKGCSYDDFETVYKIVRKLRLLQLDIESAWGQEDFDINKTNLFHLSEQVVQDFKYIDDLLEHNTLYELFQGYVQESAQSGSESSGGGEEQVVIPDDEKREIVQEQTSEVDLQKQKTVRQDIVTRVWGSETELTRAAYDSVNADTESSVESYLPAKYGISNVGQLKNAIIDLKLKNQPTDDDKQKLKILLGAFVNYVEWKKEQLVNEQMNIMWDSGRDTIQKKDDSVKAKVMEPQM